MHNRRARCNLCNPSKWIWDPEQEKYFHSYKIFKYQVIPAVLKQEKVGVQIKKWKDVVNTGWLLLNQLSQNYPPFPTIFSDPSLNCIKTLVHKYICLIVWVLCIKGDFECLQGDGDCDQDMDCFGNLVCHYCYKKLCHMALAESTSLTLSRLSFSHQVCGTDNCMTEFGQSSGALWSLDDDCCTRRFKQKNISKSGSPLQFLFSF